MNALLMLVLAVIFNSKLDYCRQLMDIVNFFKLLALTMPAYMNTLKKKACHLYDNRNKHTVVTFC